MSKSDDAFEKWWMAGNNPGMPGENEHNWYRNCWNAALAWASENYEKINKALAFNEGWASCLDWMREPMECGHPRACLVVPENPPGCWTTWEGPSKCLACEAIREARENKS